MLRVNGVNIQNFPEGFEESLDDLMMGELNSERMKYLKTPLHVYGRTIDEIVKYALLVKDRDSQYDSIDIFYEKDENERRFCMSKRF